MTEPQAVLFDIDGTLISTGGAGARSWRYAFDELYGIPADIGQFTDAGMTDPTVARLTFKSAVGHDPTPRELATVMAAYLDRIPYEVEHSEKYRVLDGAEELLRRLGREKGVLLGITSGAVEAAAHIKLSRAGFNRYFPFGGYGSDSADRIELTQRALERGAMLLGEPLDPKQVLVVGDTPKDLDAAHGAGCVAVGVATGHYTREQLDEAGADVVLDSLRDPFPGAD
ncbi:MAG: phosphoglycolate phosphatase [Thermoleophilaceae bacterium]|jgi:phosphoglycolate phosphatase-like HAD superfamily hydrolase|nr:phosphoglycolate phosphatase [Thermoleophilaceae bacterium]